MGLGQSWLLEQEPGPFFPGPALVLPGLGLSLSLPQL